MRTPNRSECDTHPRVRFAEAAGLLEDAAVEGQAEADLGSGCAARDVLLDRLVGGHARARAAVQVSLVVGDVGPRPGVVVRLEHGTSVFVKSPGGPPDWKLTMRFQKLSAASIFLKS